jgi:flagellar hook-length control protein FliK
LTSHFTAISPTSSATVPGLANSAPPGRDSKGVIFGAILSALQGGASSATSATKGTGFSAASAGTNGASTSSNTTNLLAAIEKLLGGATSPQVAAPPTDAAASDAGTPPKLMKDLVGALADLEKSQQNGDRPDEDLLKRLKKAIDAVASFLATQPQLSASPTGNTATPDATPTTPTAGTTSDAAIDTSTKSGMATADALATARTALSGLDAKLNALSTASATRDPDLSAKLTALAKALDPTTVTADTLAQLGLNAAAPTADTDLAKAINALAATKTSASSAPQPALAAPFLKLPTQSALGTQSGGKPDPTGISHSSSSPAPSQTATVVVPAKDATSDQHASDRKSADAAVANADTTVHTPAASTGQSDGPAGTAQAATPTTAATASTAAAKVAQTAYQAATPAPINLPQMAYEVVRHAQQGSSHFQIRLDPADLGRVDVRMTVDASGTVNAQMTVDRPETLDLLKRDQAQLSQAFTQAGLDGSKTTMQFSLNQNPTRQDNPQGRFTRADADDDADTVAPLTASTAYRGAVSTSALNLLV